jgi:hypothetical protein
VTAFTKASREYLNVFKIGQNIKSFRYEGLRTFMNTSVINAARLPLILIDGNK